MATRWIGLALALLMAISAVAALTSGFALGSQPDAAGLEVSAGASGEALVVTGPVPFALDQAAPTTGRLDVQAVDEGGRWSPLQSQDTVDLTAEFTHPRDGATYRVEMTKPMRQEPEGRYTTWFGVGLGHAHHGDTGIDTSSLPRVAKLVAAVTVQFVEQICQVPASAATVRPVHRSEHQSGPPA